MVTHEEAPAATPSRAVAPALLVERYFAAQCLKDETMAESIAQAYTAGAIGGKRPLVVHINGAFHSDFGDGAVERTRRRLPTRRVAVLTFEAVRDLDRVVPDDETKKRADYVVYTLASPAPATAVAPAAGR